MEIVGPFQENLVKRLLLHKRKSMRPIRFWAGTSLPILALWPYTYKRLLCASLYSYYRYIVEGQVYMYFKTLVIGMRMCMYVVVYVLLVWLPPVCIQRHNTTKSKDVMETRLSNPKFISGFHSTVPHTWGRVALAKLSHQSYSTMFPKNEKIQRVVIRTILYTTFLYLSPGRTLMFNRTLSQLSTDPHLSRRPIFQNKKSPGI